MKEAFVVCGVGAAAPGIRPQEATVPAPESMVLENVPGIPATLAETIGRYTETRDAFQTDWHPTRREMIIGTRFGNTYQAHVVKMPGGARQQLTFSPEPVYGASYHPKDGNYLLFQKDVGGGRVVPVLSLRRGIGRKHACDGRKVAKHFAALVFEWRFDRVCFDAPQQAGHRFVGDESGQPENGSSR
jgi:hypothetical protein